MKNGQDRQVLPVFIVARDQESSKAAQRGIGAFLGLS